MNALSRRVRNLEEKTRPNTNAPKIMAMIGPDTQPEETCPGFQRISPWYVAMIIGGTTEEQKEYLDKLRVDPKYQKPQAWRSS